jgi:hypothetical protein
LMVVDFQHPHAVKLFHPVPAPLQRAPGRPILGVSLVEAPQEVDEAFDIVGRDRPTDNHVAKGDPAPPVVLGENPGRQGFLDVVR